MSLAPKRTTSHEEALCERLQDPEYAVEYLTAALEDDSDRAEEVFLLALRQLARAQGISRLADATGLNRESLYRMLSPAGNPSVSTLRAVLKSLGLRIAIVRNEPDGALAGR